MSKNNGGPAFPRSADDFNGTKHGNGAQDGMTLRDYFAAKAMAAIYASRYEWESTGGPRDCAGAALMNELAIDAYQMADAMLKAREA